jgi:hypothetical protein
MLALTQWGFLAYARAENVLEAAPMLVPLPRCGGANAIVIARPCQASTSMLFSA